MEKKCPNCLTFNDVNNVGKSINEKIKVKCKKCTFVFNVQNGIAFADIAIDQLKTLTENQKKFFYAARTISNLDDVDDAKKENIREKEKIEDQLELLTKDSLYTTATNPYEGGIIRYVNAITLQNRVLIRQNDIIIACLEKLIKQNSKQQTDK